MNIDSFTKLEKENNDSIEKLEDCIDTFRKSTREHYKSFWKEIVRETILNYVECKVFKFKCGTFCCRYAQGIVFFDSNGDRFLDEEVDKTSILFIQVKRKKFYEICNSIRNSGIDYVSIPCCSSSGKFSYKLDAETGIESFDYIDTEEFLSNDFREWASRA